jgi:hypothetical protein
VKQHDMLIVQPSHEESFNEDDRYLDDYHDETVSDSLDSNRDLQSLSERMVSGTLHI